jgi:Na+/H+ antiporter NhaD/arsenite permease-like protein
MFPQTRRACYVVATLLSYPLVCYANEHAEPLPVPGWSVIPFVLLLLGIAALPLAAPHFWHSNRNRALFTAALSLPTVSYLCFEGAPAIQLLLHALKEYSSFILLIATLYTVCGGLLVSMKSKPTPLANTGLLAVGAVLANVIGTTGAAMVLIRPFLRINRERQHKRHLAVFFIFVVCNVGGLLTPLGDPPLFLGFLRKVDFFWTLSLWPQWLVANGMLLIVFFVWESRVCRWEPPILFNSLPERQIPFQLRGRRNILLLVGVLMAVLMQAPEAGQGVAGLISLVWPCPDLTMHWPLPEIIMGLLLLASWLGTPRDVRESNGFSWGPIIEVAVVFLGIFITMVPALELLRFHSGAWGVTAPWKFFWITGLVSSFLDNAPTYLTFATIAAGKGATDFQALSLQRPLILAAISCGAVFMGANTYIGNGPNFMVKAICDENKMPCPSFFGYMAYAFVILVPIWALLTVLFFMG